MNFLFQYSEIIFYIFLFILSVHGAKDCFCKKPFLRYCLLFSYLALPFFFHSNSLAISMTAGLTLCFYSADIIYHGSLKLHYTADEHFNIIYAFARKIFDLILFSFFYDLLLQNSRHLSTSFFATESPLSLGLKFFFVFLLIDIKSYWVHRAQHKFLLWWQFHMVHHTTEHMSVLAAERDNFFEYLFTEYLTTVLIGVIFRIPPDLMTYGFFLPQTLIGAEFSHSSVRLKSAELSWWQHIISSPSVHGEHHKVGKTYCNYGTIFIFWDIIFGTFSKPNLQNIEYGLGANSPLKNFGFFRQQLHGFKMLLIRRPI